MGKGGEQSFTPSSAAQVKELKNISLEELAKHREPDNGKYLLPLSCLVSYYKPLEELVD